MSNNSIHRLEVAKMRFLRATSMSGYRLVEHQRNENTYKSGTTNR
jgi:hypothetical protein